MVWIVENGQGHHDCIKSAQVWKAENWNHDPGLMCGSNHPMMTQEQAN